jgi:nucleoside-diphosphate-sugar epimerase
MTPRPIAFVAGATGYTGLAVVRAIVARGGTAIAHVRPDSPSLGAARARFAAMGASIDTTAWNPEALRATLERMRPTHVFALLGITKARARARARAGAPTESYESVDYGLTAMLLDATRHAAPAALFVYLSSLGASETRSNEYVRVRGRIERAIRDSHLSALIVRPSFITGPDRDESRPTERIAASVANSVLAVLALLGGRTLRDRFGSMTATDLAESTVTLALQPGTGVRIVDPVGLRGALRHASRVA